MFEAFLKKIKCLTNLKQTVFIICLKYIICKQLFFDTFQFYLFLVVFSLFSKLLFASHSYKR